MTRNPSVPKTEVVNINSAYFVIFIVIFILYVSKKRSKNYIAVKNLRKKGEKPKMKALALNFINKDCMIYTFNDRQVSGIIKEVTDNALLVENNGSLEAINLDFVVRIREYPRNKNGKRKSIVTD